MAGSNTVICNLALTHLGVGKDIANLATENSAEARACRRVYDTLLDQVLADFPWPFATKIATLNLIEEDPNEEWDFSYAYPTDCVHLRKIQSGVRNDTRQSEIPYRIAQEETDTVILTDQVDAIAEYTVRVTVTERYPADFVMAFSLLIASVIAPQMTGGDPFKMGERALVRYDILVGRSKANAKNEETDDELPESEFVRTRE